MENENENEPKSCIQWRAFHAGALASERSSLLGGALEALAQLAELLVAREAVDAAREHQSARQTENSDKRRGNKRETHIERAVDEHLREELAHAHGRLVLRGSWHPSFVGVCGQDGEFESEHRRSQARRHAKVAGVFIRREKKKKSSPRPFRGRCPFRDLLPTSDKRSRRPSPRKIPEASEMASAFVRAVAVTLLLWLCCCCEAVSATPTPTLTSRAIGNKSEWWTEDHPHMYRYRYKRFPNGSFALHKDDEEQKVTWKEVRANLTADTTPFERFFYATKSRRFMKDVYRHVLMSLVPPSAHGSVMKRARIQNLQSKMVKSYFLHTIAIPGVKMIGGLIVDAIKLHYGGYIQRQMMFKKMATMPLEEIYAELNLTPPAWDADAYFDANRPNYSKLYEWRGLPQMYPKPSVEFAPYVNYSLMYYSLDDDLPAPVLPAHSYPWPWRHQLAETRDLILHVMTLNSQAQEQEMAQLMKEEEEENSSAAAGGGSGSDSPGDPSSEPVRHRHLQTDGSASLSSSVDLDREVGGDDETEVGDEDAEGEFEAVEEFEKIVVEYHFSTGIPRILRQNSSYSPFPTLESLLNENIDETPETTSSNAMGGGGRDSSSNSSDTSSYAGESAGFSLTQGNPTSVVLPNDQTANATAPSLLRSFNATTSTNPSLLNQKQERAREAERKRKTILLEAMRQFYAYRTVDKSMVLVPKVGGKTPYEAQPADVNCSVAAPCLVQSGVTVFTPQLIDLDFFEKVVVNPEISKEQQRTVRVKMLQSMVEVAFQAEQKALEFGIQAPSTVWYSHFDRNVDEFADALQSHVNSTWRNGTGVNDADGTAVSALDVYTSLVEDTHNSIFYTRPSYYWTTLRDTKRSATVTKVVPTIEPLSEAEQVELLTYIAAKMKELDRAIAAFIEKRNADEEYRQVVNATATRMDYEGSQYSTLGFGVLLLATNRKNVLYRELKLPVPFHLALRVLVRFQESRLLLQDESFHMVTCLAMLRSEISYYRCRPHASD